MSTKPDNVRSSENSLFCCVPADGDRDRNDRERDRGGGGGSDRDRDRERTRIGDWSEHVSSSGKKYYYNCKTEVSQWEKPKEWLDKERWVYIMFMCEHL